MRAARIAWTVAGTWMLVSGAVKTIGAAAALQRPGFHQGAHALFEVQRIALGALDQQAGQRLHGRVGTEQRSQQLLGALAGQRIDAKLGVVGLGCPSDAGTRGES